VIDERFSERWSRFGKTMTKREFEKKVREILGVESGS
jgi:hypothetical protein